MAIYTLDATRAHLHGHFSPDLPPVLTIVSGDTVRFQTIDAGWHVFDTSDPFAPPPYVEPRDERLDRGHALTGPVAVTGAQPGLTLEVRIKTVRTGRHGYCVAGGWPSPYNDRLGLAEPPEWRMRWALDPDARVATGQDGRMLAMRPFMGVMGMPPAEPGIHSTVPPRSTGGNIDCKELTPGSRLFLPIAAPGGLFSVGDGHAVQGDGEVAGPALECPMEQVELEFHLRRDLALSMPRAETPTGWITFGFHEDLDEAMFQALDAMLDLLGELHGYGRREAMAMASLVVELRVTQIVNGARGVHAMLPHGALRQPGGAHA